MTAAAGHQTPGQDPAAPIETEDVPCTGCGAHDDEVLFEGREHEYRNTTNAMFPIVRCKECGLVRLNPRPAVSELGRIYPAEYYAYHLVHDDGGAPGLGERIKAKRYQKRFRKLLERAAPGNGPARVLDVGCADGRLLTWYRDAIPGRTIETYGIDIGEEAVERAKAAGHIAVAGRFEMDKELPDGTFDLIVASHVIEHVDDPVGFARRAAELLKPGGVFMFATPNVDSADVRRFGRFWGGWHFPRHWTLYDPQSAQRLADRIGLNVEQISYEVNPVFWNWTCHARLRESRGDDFADKLFPPVSIFQPGLQSFVLLSIFTIVDIVQKLITGRTASMQVELRRPV
ncbi:MAG TPA: class I SAM-dependent methyltransferase [Mycobacteriales bacterium]|jgi:SAM-dependent methyltransferase|nr:class I SAM-dependent methyltransferase [Mycobacteriales bacterium]